MEPGPILASLSLSCLPGQVGKDTKYPVLNQRPPLERWTHLGGGGKCRGRGW